MAKPQAQRRTVALQRTQRPKPYPPAEKLSNPAISPSGTAPPSEWLPAPELLHSSQFHPAIPS
jgi:hypothetical protein